MKVFVISDNVDTQKGMRLAGIPGCVAHGRQEVIKAIDQVLEDKDIGVLLITEKAQEQALDYISDIKLNRRLPLITGIPDRHGFRKNKNAITDYIKEAIGIKI